jgi:small subunit ribosomal protein S1
MAENQTTPESGASATSVASKAAGAVKNAQGKFIFAEPAEAFDWAETSKKGDNYSTSERDRLEELYGKTLTSINEMEVIWGSIVSIGKKEVVINIGYKSEGVLPSSEFRYNPDLKVGDKVPVYVTKQEDRTGQLIISHKTARVHDAWRRVNDSLEKDEIITGIVKCRTKGGLIVDVFGIEAFLPGSQIDVKPIRDYDVYVGKQMEFKVVKINKEFKNVVVSHKALIEAELEEQKRQIISGLEKGQVLEGIVKNITSYGVFVDLGGVDGLIHITDLSWGRINHPEELLQLDQKLNVVILDFDDEKKRIALGLKQLSAHPWEALDPEIKVGDKIKGKVVVIADYGAFVEVAPGVEGLIHVSEMSWSQHLRSAQDFLKVGDEVEAIVLSLDRDERKMSLGIKQTMPDPWSGIQDRYPVASRHKAKVRNFTHFGVFVELEEGVDGLIHISDLSWSKKVKHPSEFCNVGDELDVVVLELDVENRRLSLGHKQLEENPWEVFETIFSEGSVHQGTIVRKEGSQFVVSLPYGVEGYTMTKQLKKEDGSTAGIDEALDFVVTEFNKNARRIMVSHTKLHEEGVEAPKETKKKSQKSGGSDSGIKAVQEKIEKTTLGDLGVLEGLKEEMEKKEGKTPRTTKAKKTADAPAPSGEEAADQAENPAE